MFEFVDMLTATAKLRICMSLINPINVILLSAALSDSMRYYTLGCKHLLHPSPITCWYADCGEERFHKEIAPWRGQVHYFAIKIRSFSPTHAMRRRGEYEGHLISYFVVINIPANISRVSAQPDCVKASEGKEAPSAVFSAVVLFSLFSTPFQRKIRL